MKPQEAIWDRSPLEQEPFLTQFQVRRFAESRRGDNWFAPLAKEILDDTIQRPAAVQWCKLAFATELEGKASKASNTRRPNPKELPASVEVFVRFYWALFNDDEEGALKLLNRERKKRNCGYQAELPRKGPRPTHQAGGTPQPQHPNNISDSQASEPWRSGGSRGTRASRRGRGREAGGATGKSKDAADGLHPAAVDVVGGTGGNKAASQSGDSEQAAGMVPTLEENLGPSPTLAICESYAAMDVPEEDKGVVVFREDIDAAAFVDDHSDPHDGELPTSVAPEEPLQSSENNAIEASPAPTAVSRTTPSDISGTTAVEVTDQETTKASAHPRKPRRKNKKARRDASEQPVRQRQPRAASNQERLSQLAKGELEYHSKAKRGLVDDIEDLVIPTPSDPQQSVTAPPTRRAKKTKLRAPSEDRDDPMSPPEANGEPDPTSESVSAPPPSRSNANLEVSTDTVFESEPAVEPSRRKKRRASRKERKIPGVDPSIRPSKRQRVKHSEASPTGASGDATPHRERRRKKPTPAYAQVLPASSSSPPPPEPGKTSETSPIPPFNGGVISVPSASETNRLVSPVWTIANFPRPQGVRQSLPGLGAPASCPALLGIPATLEEVDSIISGAAQDAEAGLKNTETNTDEWTPDLDAQDAPPDSDDEEDIPLSQVVSSRREVQAPAANLSVCETDVVERVEEPPSLDIMPVDPVPGTLPEACQPSSSGLPSPTVTLPSTAPPPLPDLPPPLLLTSIPAESPPPVIQNLVGTRVPRPVPPPVLPKKPLTARPTIWAQSRQEVCESFDWFRSYQSGVYHANDLVKGYLLSAFSASRDLFARDGRLIISHGGGKAESLHSAKGQATLLKASDQEEGDKSVRALLRTYQMGRPVALLIDDRYALFPYDLSSKPGCTYVVLGFYHIAHAWAERQPADNNIGFVVRYKFAFEWCDKQPEPWWIKQDESASLETSSIPAPAKEDNPTAEYRPCASCHAPSPMIYEQGWMCLRPRCPAFWTLLDGRPTPQDLTYSDTFLNSAYRCDHEDLEDIAPQPPAAETTNGVITSRRFTKGWHCKDCGRLSCRYKWQHWECQNCGSALQVVGKSRTPNEFWSQQNPGFMHHKIANDSGILASHMLSYRLGDGPGFYHFYLLPQNRGRIYLILGSPRINGLANEIFQEYQEQAVSGELQFRRWPLRSHQCRGELLTNYFSQNTGEPYQYVGGTANTIPFDGAPSAVVKARELIQSRMMSVMQAESQPYHFNEVLSAAYMEEQRMAFHSDAENGLGPRVASLSLGSAALMHFRPLKKYRKDSGGGQKCNALTLFLRHGDVLIMDGAEVQEYYEHTVVPLNFRIAATARYISNRNH